jgi:uncharacterized protein YecE (DUF72 family)
LVGGGRAERRQADRSGHAAAPPAARVYVYFDNDAKVRAPVDAQALRRKLRLT